ncbi:MAG: hypothetical protein M1822_001261 [Bathelium mastoideum]|nr:MAG: hypothetical protein M1822_001261 [Bathelium mastoideum]
MALRPPNLSNWRHWPSFAIGNSKDPADFISANGAASLQEMATRAGAACSSNLRPEHVRAIPPHLAARIWAELAKYQLISVVVWIVFASVYPDNILYKSHKRSLWNLYDVRPGVDQLNPLTNGNTHWITFLSVGSSKYSLGDLIAISGIKNLASLSLYQEQALLATALDDRIIRNWVRYVCGSDQPALLRRLRQLKFVAQPEITAVSVKHLSALPALVQIEFLACGSSNFLTNGIKDLGWHRPYNDWIPQQTDLARGRPPTDCPNFCEEPSEAVLHVEIMGKRFASYGDKEPDIAIHLCRYPQNTNKISEGVERSGKSYKQQQQLESPVEKHLQEESRVPPAKRRMLKPERRSNLDDTVKKLMF